MCSVSTGVVMLSPKLRILDTKKLPIPIYIRTTWKVMRKPDLARPLPWAQLIRTSLK
jgi:hypothetical protein